jgi:hypothetical protein
MTIAEIFKYLAEFLVIFWMGYIFRGYVDKKRGKYGANRSY